jgi:hypothetical protein
LEIDIILNKVINSLLSFCFKGVYGVLRKKTGTIYKRGDGPIDFNWNSRYVVLDGQSLMYFKYASERTPRGVIKLNGASVSPLIRSEVYQKTLLK